MAERALLDLVSNWADPGVRTKRAILPRAGAARGEIGSDDIRPEAAVGFPTKNGAHDGISTQVRQHGKTDFGIRVELTRVALDPPSAGAEADHSHDRAAAG
jgi:hypothetical protein